MIGFSSGFVPLSGSGTISVGLGFVPLLGRVYRVHGVTCMPPCVHYLPRSELGAMNSFALSHVRCFSLFPVWFSRNHSFSISIAPASPQVQSRIKNMKREAVSTAVRAYLDLPINLTFISPCMSMQMCLPGNRLKWSWSDLL